MPFNAQTIAQAKAAGYTDQDIYGFVRNDANLGGKAQKALEAGYSPGDVVSYLSTQNLPLATDAQSSTSSQNSQPQGNMLSAKPFDQASKEGTGSFLLNYLGNFLKAVPRDIYGIGKTVADIPVGLAEKGYDYVTGQDHSQQYEGEQLVNALPGAIAKIPGKIGNFAKEAVTDPKQALHDVGASIYEDPVNALLMASGVGDAAGLASKGTGILLDSAKVSAELAKSGLSAEEISSALQGFKASPSDITNPLYRSGAVVQDVSRSVDPLKALGDTLAKSKNIIAGGVSKILGTTTAQGDNVIKLAYTHPDIVSAAMKDPTTADALLQNASDSIKALQKEGSSQYLNKLDEENKNINSLVSAPGSTVTNKLDINQPLQGLRDTAGNGVIRPGETVPSGGFGVKAIVMDPQELDVIKRYVDLASNKEVGISAAPQEMALRAQVEQISKKYGLFNDYEPSLEGTMKNAMHGNKFNTSQAIPTQAEELQKLSQIIHDRGYLGTDFNGSAFAMDKTAQSRINDIMKISHGWEDTSLKGVDKLKQAIHGLYDHTIGHEHTPYNAFITAAHEAVQAPLMDFPGYAESQAVYGKFKDLQKEIKGAIGNPDRAAKDAVMKKIVKLVKSKDPESQRLLDLMGADPSEMAGTMLGTSSGSKNVNFAESAALTGAVLTGNFQLAGKILATRLASSPKVVGKLVTSAGKVAGSRPIQAIAKTARATNEASPAVKAVLKSLGVLP